MATIFNRCSSGGKICIHRGDTSSLVFDLQDSAGVAFDGTGRTYLLSVTSDEDPTDASTLLFSSIGAVATAQVSFPLQPADVATAVEAFYDIQETDSGSLILTIDKGEFEIKQDNSK